MADTALTQAPLKILQHPDWLEADWLIHGFSTRPGGRSTAYSDSAELNLGFTPEDDREAVLGNRRLLLAALTGGTATPTLATIRQVHSGDIHVIDDPSAVSEPATGDGLVTGLPDVVLGILTADCVPVLVADRRLRVVGAFHAGWRGTVKRIVEGGVAEMMARFGSHPSDLKALIGPAIGPCCYGVGAEVQDAFASEFAYADKLMKKGQGDGPGTIRLNLREANRQQLLACGVPQEAIHMVGSCTACEPDQYFSHRQSQGKTGRMMSVIGLRSAFEATRR